MLDNLSTADKYATLKARIDELEAELKAVRDDIKVSLSERATFDQTLAKSYLTAEQIAACTKKSVVTTLRVKAKTAEG